MLRNSLFMLNGIICKQIFSLMQPYLKIQCLIVRSKKVFTKKKGECNMKKIVILMFCITLFIGKDFAQCVNADFSQGNFNGWTGSKGGNNYGSYVNIIQGIISGVPNSPPSDTNRQTIMNVPGTDHNTGDLLSVLPPGGTSSARLGNESVALAVGGSC